MPPDESTEQPELESTPAPVQGEPDIAPLPISSIVPQASDPLFIALEKEKKRTKRLRRLLTINKNRSTVDSTANTSLGPDGGGEPEPEIQPPAPAPASTGSEKADPIDGVFRFLGGRKKKDVQR